MLKANEMTRGYQFRYMIVRQLIGMGICAFVQFLIFVPSYSNNIFRNVAGVLFAVINFCIIYDSAAVLGKADNKTYSALKYNVRYSVLWGVALSVLNMLSMVMFVLNWQFGAVDGVLENAFSVFLNVIFYILQSPYMAYLIMVPQKLPVFVVLLSALLPIVASVAGYISGKKQFSISGQINKIMFENDRKDT